MVNKLPKDGILLNTTRKEVIDEPGLIQLMTEREDLKYVTDIMPAADAAFKINSIDYIELLAAIEDEIGRAHV